MTALALEVNDAGLLLLPEGRPRPDESPCLALFEGGEVLTGALAASRAHQSPRAVHDAYLDPLDTEVLGRPFPAGIRRADLAYAHLVALRDGVPAESEVFLAVPGFWSAERLGLLLGVAKAAGLRVAGLVDAAVAAASLLADHRPALHVDLTRHRVVVTALEPAAAAEGAPLAEIERVRVASPESAGLKAFEDRLVRVIADAFVAETRFDPLHSGASEQVLRDGLPGWLRELRRLPSVDVSFRAGGREHQASVPRERLAEATIDLQRAVAREVQALRPEGDARLLVSARVSGVPGIVEHLRGATGLDALELPMDGAVSATLRHRDRLRHEGPALPFVTRLPAAGALRAKPARPGPRPTHLLLGGVAHALGSAELALGTAPPLGVRGLGLRREGVLPHHASIVVEEGELWVVDKGAGRTFLNGEPVDERRSLRAGDRLRLGDPGVELLLVAIAGGEAPNASPGEAANPPDGDLP
jgi:hypothetical protein